MPNAKFEICNLHLPFGIWHLAFGIESVTYRIAMLSRTTSTALLSRCGQYRYTLHRHWDPTLPTLVWIMLNPSTADAQTDDRTIRRCIGLARGWGYGGICVVNLFAFRATNPANLPADRDQAIGPDNDRHIARAATAATVICAWGVRGGQFGRDQQVLRLLAAAGCAGVLTLGMTKAGHPRHPLYVKGDVVPSAFLPTEV